jgi:hypothetical protein
MTMASFDAFCPHIGKPNRDFFHALPPVGRFSELSPDLIAASA